MFPIINISLLTAISLFTIHYASAYTFIGCTDTYQPQFTEPSVYHAGSASDCATHCTSLHTHYFYNQYNTGTCYCSNTSPRPLQFTYGASDMGGCEGTNYEVYAIDKPVDPMTFQGCYTTVSAPQHPGSSIPTLEGCFSACPSSKSVMYFPNPDTNSFDCKCGPTSTIDTTGGGSTTCGQYTWFTYTRDSISRRDQSLGKRRLSNQIIF
ncbi:uncharacterized protein IL334_006246 [Kwoniella shivajii]|uniref:WSC domain-containing protein n=1 Tax=Kwoniella shivajii TaxID=564305 RepID=A0ABZ1D5F0_9TREE|nr:hypothetical protein IL334_006246 [Kwoniella shivajii]